MLVPNHAPKFEKVGIGLESDAVETTLTYNEIMDWLTKNNLPHTEDSCAMFLLHWYMKYRNTNPSQYMEHQIATAYDIN